MKHEFWAEFDLYKTSERGREEDNKKLIDSIVDRGPESNFARWKFDPFLRQQILAQVLASQARVRYTKRNKSKNEKIKEYAKTGKLQDQEPSGLLFWYYGYEEHGKVKINAQIPSGPFQTHLSIQYQRYIRPVFKYPFIPRVSEFPSGSWAIQITFTLRKPYISRDDIDFYIIDNPVKKEWVFKVPYVAPSQWKGALRAAMVRKLVEWWHNQNTKDPKEFASRRFRMALLFGDEKGEESVSIKGLAKYLDEVGGDEAAKLFREKVRKYFSIPEDKPMPHFQGHLHFYPTFFDRIGLEVINPHDRKTGASAKGPIYFECVPAGTRGVFTVLYLPSDLSDKPEEAQNQAKRDLKAVLRGLYAMFKRYGFGAKTSSGYGVVKDVTCKVLKNWKIHTEAQGAQG